MISKEAKASGAVEADTSQLKKVGDYKISMSESGEPQISIVTEVKVGRGWSRGNPGLSDPHLSAPVSYRTEEPIIKIFTKETFPQALKDIPLLMINLRQGVFEELTREGFTGNLAEIDQPIDYNLEALKIIDKTLEEEDALVDGKKIYYATRALIAKGLLDPKENEITVKKAKEAEKRDWIPSIVPSTVTIGIFGSDEEKKEAYSKGMVWATNENDRRRIKIIGGWSILAASATTPEEKEEAYQLVMKDIEIKYFDMSANVPIAAAILANNEQKNERYLASKKEYEETRYWAIAGGNLIAMAITAPEGEEKSKVFMISRMRLKKGYNERYTKKDIVVMALTAQTQEEKNFTFKLIEEYSNTKQWNNLLNGWANVALGILGCDDRELAIKSVAGLMEPDDD